MTQVPAFDARFPDVPQKGGHYESLYLTAHHPSAPEALWIRHTVQKPPGSAPRASLWVTHFGPDSVRAGKVTTDAVDTSSDWPIIVGEHAGIGPAGAVGGIEQDALQAAWDLRFDQVEAPFHHLPRGWMYRAPVPRTKSISAIPSLELTGSLAVGGAAVDLTGWRGSVGHNWGSEHAERWIWLRGSGFDTDPSLWLDVVIGRVRIGRVLTPWIANGAVSLDGRRHRVGGLRRARRGEVTELSDGATIQLVGDDISVEVQIEVDRDRCVGWNYSDPAGHGHEVVNSSVAALAAVVTRPDHPPLTLRTVTGAYEIGALERALDVALQPFPD